MNLKQFMEENSVTAFEIVKGKRVINAIVDQTPYGLKVDMSDIPFATKLDRIDGFVKNGDIIIVDGIEIDSSTIELL